MKIPQSIKIGLFLTLLLGSLGGGLPAAGGGELSDAEPARLRLVSGVAGTEGQEAVRIGLHIALAPGWKTYWRSPGEAGIPPSFDWSGSRNLAQAIIHWPRPSYFESFGMGSWGYHGEVLFPIDVELATPGAPLDIQLRLQLGLCKDICIPFEHELSLSLAPTAAVVTPEAGLIDAYARRIPREAGGEAALAEAISAATTGGREFTLTVTSRSALRAPEVIIEGKNGSYFEIVSETAASDTERRFHVTADLPSKSDRLTGQDITVTVIDGDRAAEKKLRIR